MTAREGRAAGFCMKAMRRQKIVAFAVNAVQKNKRGFVSDSFLLIVFIGFVC